MSGVSWRELIPQPRSRFILVMCQHCGNKQIVYDHAKTYVKCSVCQETIAEPKGGRAKILGRVLEELGS